MNWKLQYLHHVMTSYIILKIHITTKPKFRIAPNIQISPYQSYLLTVSKQHTLSYHNTTGKVFMALFTILNRIQLSLHNARFPWGYAGPVVRMGQFQHDSPPPLSPRQHFNIMSIYLYPSVLYPPPLYIHSCCNLHVYTAVSTCSVYVC